MSHFSVFVLAPGQLSHQNVEPYVEQVLERWSESREVEPYPEDVDEKEPTELWEWELVKSDPRFSAEQLKAAESDWKAFIELYDAYRGAVPDPDDGLDLYQIDKYGDPVRIMTANPQSKWDWWQIGGRWWDLLKVKAGTRCDTDPAAAGAVDAIGTPRHWSDKATGHEALDGIGAARVRAVDFAAMTAEHLDLRRTQWMLYQGLVEQHGVPRDWESMLAEHGGNADKARAAYWSQPVIEAGNDAAHQAGRSFNLELFDKFLGTDEATWIADATDEAIAPWALVDLDRQWRAPGRMGCFAVSTETEQGRREFNTEVADLLRNTDPQTWLVVVDCHV